MAADPKATPLLMIPSFDSSMLEFWKFLSVDYLLEFLAADSEATPLLMIPSFDSSVLEYRRLYPLLAAQRPVYAVDTVGWGFTDASFVADTWKASRTAVKLGPLQKREHLHAFHRQEVCFAMPKC